MSNNALLYELLINKQKVKSLNNKNNLTNEVDTDNTPEPTDTTQESQDIFRKTFDVMFRHCEQSQTIRDNINIFNEFLDNEMPLLTSKFNKYLVGKTE